MADFIPAFERTLLSEGGYRLTNIKGDRGGQTFAGISRNAWPNWSGWNAIDSGSTPDAGLVREFYRVNFWNPCGCDQINNQLIAETLYDFAVNAGVTTAVKLAQITVSATPDGRFGPKTLEAINATEPDLFLARYALAKIARYAAIVSRDTSQRAFLLGWVNRALKGSV